MDSDYYVTIDAKRKNRARVAISAALIMAEQGKVLYLSLTDPLSAVICDLHSMNAERMLNMYCGDNCSVKDRNELYKKFMLEEIKNIEVVDCPIAATVKSIDQLIAAHSCETVIADGADKIIKDGVTAFSGENRLGFDECETKLSKLGEKYHALMVLVRSEDET